MPVLNSIQDRADYFAGIRQEIHAHPELGFDTENTAAIVKRELEKMGITDIHTGIARNGLVAVIDGNEPGPVIGLRADMDALPIREETGASYSSAVEGKMHACGHDGHTATLLAAAENLALGGFKGKVVLIFQPAEEAGGGANIMCQEGLMERFGIEEVYAYHNVPGMTLGHAQFCEGPIMASTDTIEIRIKGRGGHAAFPETTIDPIPVAMRLIDAIYMIPARKIPSQAQAVISITQIHAGNTDNIIPEEAFINGTIRTLDPMLRGIIVNEIETLGQDIPIAMGCKASVNISDGYPVTVNSPEGVAQAERAARAISDHVVTDRKSEMGAEDFSFMLQKRPGAYIFFGAGDGAMLHHPAYDFNDALIPIAASWFVELVRGRD